MPGFVFHVGAQAICPHAGQVSTVTSNARVLLSGQPASTLADVHPIAGCPFTLPTTPPKPSPCVLVRWLVPATRVFVNGQPVILQTSTGLCQSPEQVPQGPPSVLVTQTRVTAT